jgi:hypothetical protein
MFNANGSSVVLIKSKEFCFFTFNNNYLNGSLCKFQPVLVIVICIKIRIIWFVDCTPIRTVRQPGRTHRTKTNSKRIKPNAI